MTSIDNILKITFTLIVGYITLLVRKRRDFNVEILIIFLPFSSNEIMINKNWNMALLLFIIINLNSD